MSWFWPSRHHEASRLLLGALLLVLLAMVANWALGGTGGLIWIGLALLGITGCVVSLVYMVSHPIQRAP